MQKVKELMSHDVEVTSPDKTIEEAAQQMQEGKFGMLPVEANGRMIGAISDRDITVRGVAEGREPSTEVREIMTKGIVTTFENDTVEDAAKLMSDKQIRRLPVLNENKQLVGILSLGDLAIEDTDPKAAGEVLAKVSAPT
ncbi:MAG: CBS domain-containing protein [Usitatibacteraceae bacterium]